MPRLTTTQYRNTIAAVVRGAFADAATADAVLAAVATPLGRLPDDRRVAPKASDRGGFRRLDQTLQEAHVAGYYEVASALGDAMTAQARLGAALGACATDADAGNDRACATAFLRKLAALAIRRPLSADDDRFYVEEGYAPTGALDRAALADAITVLLASPRLLYQVSGSGDAVAGKTDVYRLDAHELATRLAYHLWQAPPDAALVAAAKDGSLVTADGYRKQVDRLLADPRARTSLDEFFADWLRLADVPALDARNADPAFKAFAGATLPSADLRAAVAEDALGLLRYTTFDAPEGSRGIDAVLTTNRSFARSRELADVYGAPVWDGKAEPPAIADGKRPGLLTRVGALFPAANPRTRPIMRGLFVRTAILCDEVPPPPPSAMAMANDTAKTLDPSLSTRAMTEAITQAPGSTCLGCHGTLLNPIGFALEAFDSLGRLRTEERVLDEKTGKELARRPIDTTSKLGIDDGDAATSTGPADLVKQIAASSKPAACLARQSFRFTFQRWDDEEVDGCALAELQHTLQSERSLRAMFRQTALVPAFAERSFR
jgi:hypothetical protein